MTITAEDVAIEKSKIANAYDKLNAAWKRAELKIANYMIPYEFSIPSGDGCYLGWIRYGNEYRLCYGEDMVDIDDTEETPGIDFKPILDCKAEIRLRMVPYLHKLIIHARNEMSGVLTQVLKSYSQLCQILDETKDS